MSYQDPQPLLAADLEERAYRRLSNVDSRIRNEYDFISSRTGWLLASHAFLFTGLAVLLTQPPTSLPRLRTIRTVMMIALPLIGVLSSYLIWQAVRGAYHVLRLHQDLSRELESLLARHFRYSFAAPRQRDLKAGERPPIWLPLILGTVWLLLLLLIATDVAETVIDSGVFAIARDV
jgi:hypothetical protein